MTPRGYTSCGGQEGQDKVHTKQRHTTADATGSHKSPSEAAIVMDYNQLCLLVNIIMGCMHEAAMDHDKLF